MIAYGAFRQQFSGAQSSLSDALAVLEGSGIFEVVSSRADGDTQYIEIVSYDQDLSIPVERQRKYLDEADRLLQPFSFERRSHGSTTPQRAYGTTVSIPPNSSDKGVVAHPEPLSNTIAWSSLRTLAEVENAGVTLFQAGAHNPIDLWREFSGYVRQARTYFDAAEKVSDTSASLLIYYCALQLAKAELLRTVPDRVYQTKIYHGISHDIANAGDPSVDRLRVMADGVFPRLYEKRMGTKLPPNTELSILELLKYVPEVAMEVEEAGLGVHRPLQAFHVAAMTPDAAWSSVLTFFNGFLKDPGEGSTQAIETEFQQMAPPPNWRQMIGASVRINPMTLRFYQARKTTPPHTGISKLAAVTAPSLRTMADNSLIPTCDFMLCPTIDRAGLIPMNCALARYLLVFYLSSLVRYKPSILDSSRHPTFAWIFESFTTQVALPLVVNFYDGITGRWSDFGGRYSG
ncbi:YaaC family protein [Actinoplanes sp. CA-051413]|uniref:YaaC family protein n=1 Tax=Actinoplanes sp. CA-051413 TaxID=3239899 RepID=UPI003D980CA8